MKIVKSLRAEFTKLYRIVGGGEKRKNPPKHFASADFGPSEKIRTSGLLNPIQARYQLRYTRISHLLK